MGVRLGFGYFVSVLTFPFGYGITEIGYVLTAFCQNLYAVYR